MNGIYTKHLRTGALTLAASALLTLSACDDTEEYVPPGGDTGTGDLCEEVTCGANASCDAATGTCACDDGFEGDGQSCEEIVTPDSCEGVTCGANASCDATTGTCACDEGFEGDGQDCTAEELPLAACLLVTTTDYTNGALAVIDLATGEASDAISDIHQDAAVTVLDEEVYILNRYQKDTLVRLDAGYQLLWEEAFAADSNPSAVVAVGEDLYVALRSTGELLRLHRGEVPVGEQRVIDTITVTPTLTTDGAISELSALHVRDGILYALAEGLNDTQSCESDGVSTLYAFSLPALTPANVFAGNTASSLELDLCNASSLVVLDPDTLLIPASGGLKGMGALDDDGGLQLVDLATGTLGDVVLNEGDYDGLDLSAIVLTPEDELFGVGMDASWSYSLFPITRGAVWSAGDVLATSVSTAMLGWDGALYYAGFGGVVTLDPTTGDAIGEAITLGMSGSSVALLEREGACW